MIIDIAATRSIGSLRRVLGPGGIFVQVGAAKHGGWIGIFGRIIEIVWRTLVLKQRVKFFVATSSVDDLAALRDLIAGGRVRPVIERTYPLSEAREAVRYVGTGQARAKVVITSSVSAWTGSAAGQG